MGCKCVLEGSDRTFVVRCSVLGAVDKPVHGVRGDLSVPAYPPGDRYEGDNSAAGCSVGRDCLMKRARLAGSKPNFPCTERHRRHLCSTGKVDSLDVVSLNVLTTIFQLDISAIPASISLLTNRHLEERILA